MNLSTASKDPGMLRILLFEHKQGINKGEELVQMYTQLQSAQTGHFKFSSFLLQDSNTQQLQLGEIVFQQICIYTGEQYRPISSTDP